MVKYIVISRTRFVTRPNAYITKRGYYAKCTTLARNVEGIQAARKIGYRAVMKNKETEVYIAMAGSKLDVQGFPITGQREVLLHRYEDHGKKFVGIMADRQNTPGVKMDHRLVMVRPDGSIWYDSTVWS